ncbi:MAG: alpha/beta hydrolase [Xanthobacteraceae bacterium]
MPRFTSVTAGKDPAVVLLHGFGDTGDMWAPVATALCKDHTVVVPDLRGMGLSPHPPGGYDKKTQAQDIAQVLDRLKIETAALVTHDIGNTVGYAFAANFRRGSHAGSSSTRRCRGSDPGPTSCAIRKSGTSIFAGPMSSAWSRAASVFISIAFGTNCRRTPKKIGEANRRHYARLYARPHAMHCAFEQFAAFTQDAIDNKAFAAKGKLIMPILALGGDHSYKTLMADIMRLVGSDVTGGVITDSGHWVMESSRGRPRR